MDQYASTILAGLGLLVLCHLALGMSALEEYPNFVERTTADGILRGVEREGSGVRYAAYLGVPYAESPVGPLRFMPPREISPWAGIRNATEATDPCIHPLRPVLDDGRPPFSGTTDCLTLDIYVPSTPSAGAQSDNASANASSHADGTGRGKAVLAYISGDPEEGMESSTTLTHDGLIIVVIKHRVGVFGYLSVGTPDAPGNLGLLDQELALRWIQRNIGFLDGDPNRVTVFGGYQSFVSLHLYTMSDTGQRPLFQRLIADSGARTTGDIFQEPPADATYKLGVLLNCTVTEKSELLQCLRSRSDNDIAAAEALLYDDKSVSNIWRPFFDAHVMSTSITRQNVDVIVGFSSSDSELALQASRNRNIDFSGNSILPPFMKNVSTQLSHVVPGLSGSSLLQTLIRQQYGDWSQPDTQSSLGFVSSAEVMSDLHILLPGFSFLKDVTSEAPTSAVYVFVREFNMTSPYKSRLLDILASVGTNSSKALSLDEERQLSDDIRRYFVNFIIAGDPNRDRSGEVDNVTLNWPTYDAADRRHLAFTLTGIKVRDHYKASELAFWKITFPQVEKYLETIDCDITSPGNIIATTGAELNRSPTLIPDTSAYTKGTTTSPSEVAVHIRGLRMELTARQASTIIQVLLVLSIILICLVIALAFVAVTSRLALRKSLEQAPPKRGVAGKKSIRGSSTAWLWKPRDHDDTTADDVEEADRIKGILKLDTQV